MRGDRSMAGLIYDCRRFAMSALRRHETSTDVLNAQLPVIRRRLGKRFKSTLCGPSRLVPGTEGMRTREVLPVEIRQLLSIAASRRDKIGRLRLCSVLFSAAFSASAGLFPYHPKAPDAVEA